LHNYKEKERNKKEGKKEKNWSQKKERAIKTIQLETNEYI